VYEYNADAASCRIPTNGCQPLIFIVSYLHTSIKSIQGSTGNVGRVSHPAKRVKDLMKRSVGIIE
jgi:hypothetical protein